MAHNDSALPLCGVKQTKAKIIIMSNIIQELRTWTKDEAEKAKSKANNLERRGFDEESMKFYFASAAFSAVIQKLDLLLDAETQATVKKPEA